MLEVGIKKKNQAAVDQEAWASLACWQDCEGGEG